MWSAVVHIARSASSCSVRMRWRRASQSLSSGPSAHSQARASCGPQREVTDVVVGTEQDLLTAQDGLVAVLELRPACPADRLLGGVSAINISSSVRLVTISALEQLNHAVGSLGRRRLNVAHLAGVAHPVDAAAADVDTVLAVVSHDFSRGRGRSPRCHSLEYRLPHGFPTCQVRYFSVPYRGTVPPCGTASGGTPGPGVAKGVVSITADGVPNGGEGRSPHPQGGGDPSPRSSVRAGTEVQRWPRPSCGT